MAKKKTNNLTVETLKHEEATRKNIPTAEHQSVMYDKEKSAVRVAYERRNLAFLPFDKPKTWRIAVKVINHLGDEVMKVFQV